jgi:hypothetical protein
MNQSSEIPATAEPTRWPLIVGVIGLVYGILGSCMYSFGGVWLFIGPSFMASFMGMSDFPAMPNVWFLLFSSVAAVILGIMLIVGSVQLLRRRPSAGKTLLAWVVGRMILVVIGLVGGFVTLPSQIEYAERMDAAVREMVESRQAGASASMPPFDRARQEQIGRWSLIGMNVLVVAFPLFVGILLTNPKKRAEIESWRDIIR